MQLDPANEAHLRKRLEDICDGFKEAVDREVETLRREGFPIYVSDNGQIIDLQQTANLP